MAVIVIPARYGSERLPGKPLQHIAGRTMLDRVCNIAKQAAQRVPGTKVLVATDDARIVAHCGDLHVSAVMTSPELKSGTDRTLAAISAAAQDEALVLNLQGDAPFTPVTDVVRMIEALATGTSGVVTPVRRLSWQALDSFRETKKVSPTSGTTCVRAPDGHAFWFSKMVLPLIRNEAQLRTKGPDSPVFQHVGLYAYRIEALRQICAAPPSTYEVLEGLEQLRFLELGIRVMTVEVDLPRFAMSGVDTPEDARKAEALIAQHGDPYVVIP